MKPNIGEAQITPQLTATVAPDVATPQGQNQLVAKAVAANQIKVMLDKALEMASKAVGGTFSSRVKDLDTAQKKIVQKRLQGRDYGVSDVNDMLGGRITVNSKGDFGAAKKEIEKMADTGMFKIKKAEPVKQGNYEAFHFDVTMPNGLGAELQIHTHQSEAEAVANHDMRAIHGENPPKQVKKLVDTQAGIIKDLPNPKARAVADALQTLHKQNDNKPIDTKITASIIKHIATT